MTLSTLLPCLAAVTALALTPGLDTLLVIKNCARGGKWDGIATALGGGIGLFIHATLSALGISLLLLHTAWAFALLRYTGAAWLLWLGFTSLRQMYSTTTPNSTSLPVAPQQFTFWGSLREGLLCNVLNPKVILFYMAFISQFIDPQRDLLSQSMLIALLHFSVAMLYLTILSCGIEHSRHWLQKKQVYKVFHGISGTLLVGFGLHLLLKK